MKFKIGDKVITRIFEEKMGFVPQMSDFIGIEGVISIIRDGDPIMYRVNSWWWLESALTLVEEIVEEKQEEKQEENKDEEMPVYILQKDTPDYKAGEEFEPDVFGYYTAKKKSLYGTYGQWRKSLVENNPEWFKKKEAPKPYIYGFSYGLESFVFRAKEKPESAMEHITITKKRLSEIVIAESKGKLVIDDK